MVRRVPDHVLVPTADLVVEHDHHTRLLVHRIVRHVVFHRRTTEEDTDLHFTNHGQRIDQFDDGSMVDVDRKCQTCSTDRADDRAASAAADRRGVGFGHPRFYPTDRTMPLPFRITMDTIDYTTATITDVLELVCWFDRPPPLGARVKSKWELVGAVRSSNKGYKAKQFDQVTVCDIDPTDDPFSPDHLSSVHVVEVFERSMYRRRYVIWRISILDGIQQRLCQFDEKFDIFNQQQWNARLIRDVNCFQSRGVIFICLRKIMCVYDTRYRVFRPCSTKIATPSTLVYVGFIRRLFKANGSLDGWMIRIVARGYQRENDGRLRIRMVNWTVPLTFGPRKKNFGVGVEEIVFGRIGAHGHRKLRMIRTTTNGPALVFDGSTGQYLYWARFRDVFRDDGIFKKSSRLPYLAGTSPYIPVYSNQRECIRCTRNGLIYRAQFEPPTLKYLAAKRAFNVNPKLRCMITADQFRNATGMGRMDAHLVRKI